MPKVLSLNLVQTTQASGLLSPDKLKVSYRMWDRANHLSSMIKGREVKFKNLAEAREVAKANGYSGIRVQ